jgi:hypothetical protein
MTSSVTEKKLIPANERRRYTDTPGLWVAIVISSLSLHLLVFWLMRSSYVFKPWFPQTSENFVPIEFIELPPAEELTDKSPVKAEIVSPKSNNVPQESPPDTTPENLIAASTPTNQDTETLNSDASVVNENTTATSSTHTNQDTETLNSDPSVVNENTTATSPASASDTQLFPETKVTTPTPTPTPTIPVGDLPWNQRQEVVLGEGKILPTDIPSIPSELPQVAPADEGKLASIRDEFADVTPTEEIAQTPTEDIAPTPTEEIAQIPTEDIAPTPTEETSSDLPELGVQVTFTAIPRTELDLLIQQGRIRPDGLPDVLAVHKGSNSKSFELAYLPGDVVIEPAQFLASLIIDHHGNFEQSVILEIEPNRLRSKSSVYERIINDFFMSDRFLPGHNHDGTKPEVSNLFIRMTVQPVSSN